MPSAMVFPGGAVDKHDGGDAESEETTIRRCAVREVFEEAGLAITVPTATVTPSDRAKWRKRVHDSAEAMSSFYSVCRVKPDIDSLQPVCSFVTPDFEAQKMKKGGFDARFYLYCLEETGGESSSQMSADLSETSNLCWFSPAEAINRQSLGEFSMAPPQWLILREMRKRGSFQELLAWSKQSDLSTTLIRGYPQKPFFVEPDPEHDGKFCLSLPGDSEHDTIPGPEGARRRVYMEGDLQGNVQYFYVERGITEADMPLRTIGDIYQGVGRARL